MESFKEKIDPVWKLSAKPVKANYSIVEYEEIEYKPDSVGNISNPNIDPIHLRTKDSAGMYLYQDSYVVVNVKIKVNNPNVYDDIGGGEDTHLTTTGFLFNRAVYRINERTITDHQNFALGNLIKILSEENDRYREYGTSEYWYDYINDETTAVRTAHASSSKTISIKIPIRRLSAFMAGFKKISQGLIHSLELTRSPSTLSINSSAGARIVQIQNMIWHVPKIKPSPRAKYLLNKFFLAKGSFNVGFLDWNVYPSDDIGAGRTSFEYAITTLGYKPNQVFTVLQRATAWYDHTISSDILLNLGLSNANLWLNGEKFLRYPYFVNVNHDQDDFQKLYDEFLRYNRKNEKGTLVSYNDFKDYYPMVRFDLSMADRKMLREQDTTDLVIELKFNSALENDAKAYSLVSYDRVVTVQTSDNKIVLKEPAKQPF